MREGIYIYLADGFMKTPEPYVGKTKRTLRQRIKEHLDKSPWKKNAKKKLKHISHVVEKFHFKGVDEKLLETIEEVILDALGGVDNTANAVRPKGGRPDEKKKDLIDLKKIICKGK